MASTDRKPSGRPPLYGERMRNRNVRLTDAQWAAFLTLGGPEWLRLTIAKASPDYDDKVELVGPVHLIVYD